MARQYGMGSLYEASGSFYLRYRQGEKQKSQYLCDKDNIKYRSVKDKNVKALAAQAMLTIKAAQQSPSGLLVRQFYTSVYLPFIKLNLKPYTVVGYEKLWRLHLLDFCGEMPLREFRTHNASQLLTKLAGEPSKLGSRSLSHIKALGSAIFRHAVNTGEIETNPWRDAKALGKVKADSGVTHYTVSHSLAMIQALQGHPEEQAIIALACFLGMRPGEISGLQWQDVQEDGIHIRRAVVNGIVGETKTKLKVHDSQPCSCGMRMKDCQRVPLIEPVRSLLLCIRTQDASGWVFENRVGGPANLAGRSKRIIRPILKTAKIEYRGLYPGRRGSATILTELTGDALAAQQLLRHRDLSITTAAYVHMIPEALTTGIKLLESAILLASEAKSQG